MTGRDNNITIANFKNEIIVEKGDRLNAIMNESFTEDDLAEEKALCEKEKAEMLTREVDEDREPEGDAVAFKSDQQGDYKFAFYKVLSGDRTFDNNAEWIMSRYTSFTEKEIDI